MTSLLSEKAPLIVSAWLAAAGWVLVHLTENLTNSPSIEYEIEYGQDSTSAQMAVTLYNLSRTQTYHGLEFAFSLANTKGGSFQAPAIDARPPASIQTPPTSSSETNADTILFKIPNFYPNARMILSAQYSGAEKPVFRLTQTKDAVNLVRKGWETYFVDHESIILIWGVGVWLLFLLLYWCFTRV